MMSVQPDGTYLEWYKDGCLRSKTTYKDGSFDGTRTIWHGGWRLELLFASGRLLKEETYYYDRRDGKCRQWDKSGKLKIEETYRNDVLISKVIFR